MSDLQPAGHYPTPYGISVPVYRPAEPNPQDPDAFVFTMEATAICAGIYDRDERNRFIADANRVIRDGRCPAFEQYGGHKVPIIPLRRPAEPLYPKMPAKHLTPVEAWVTGALDYSRWCDRADFLIDIIGDNMEQAGVGEGPLCEIYPLSVSTLLTVALEHLCEAEVGCIEAAAFYSVSMHSEFSEAGLEWLHPFRATWFRDWILSRPRFVTFARALREPMLLPDWVCRLEEGRA